MNQQTRITCHECDLLQQLKPPPPGGCTRCPRCGAVLHRSKRNSLNRTLALSLAGLILFIIANTFPFLAFEMQGQITETQLFTGVTDLYHQGMWGLAALVLFTTIIVPAVQLTLMLYVLVPIKLGRTPGHLAGVFRLLQTLTPWGMMEVFMLGILVSVVKLAGMATIVPGLALWAFGLLIFVLAAAAAALDPHRVWEKVRYAP
ncbi:MAG TPA: paraquat-inducible protein A [Candidatus Competibacteraceae bacterium]|nr:paraquat-inducible protein A [Candidatus Competibacteraceae bacterium]HRY18994.1 paraquat-inducible protein A [Candidatus Competibacteraceae bacterium]